MSSKVLHICLSDGWGGLEMYPSRIIPELERQGWQAHGLALRDSRVAHSLRDAAVEPLEVASRGKALLVLPRLLRYLTQHDIGVVHCHKSSDLRLAVLLKTLRPRLRLFFTDHMGVTRPKKDPYHRWVYGKLDRLFSISEATRARNLRAFPLPAERIRRLYLGVDPAPFVPQLDEQDREQLRGELGVPPEALAVGLPGRLTPGKGQLVWLQALARLCDQVPGLVFQGVLIGGTQADEGADEAYVAELRQRTAALGLEACVSFAGYRADLARVFEALDVVCVPSHNEAFGLTVIEAMAAGKPVIGADSGAIPEILDADCGRLVAPDDAAAWAEAMAQLAVDEGLRQRLGGAALRVVRERFSLEAHVASLIEAYRPQARADAS